LGCLLLMDKNKKSFIGHILNDRDGEYMRGVKIELADGRELTVSGCRGFYEYSENVIGLVLRKGRLKICGEELLCDSYTNGAVLIRGKISGISLLEGNDEVLL